MDTSDEAKSQAQPAAVTGKAITIAVVVAAGIAAFVIATELFLILFLGILFAVFLTYSGDWLAERTPVNRAVAVGIITASLMVAVLAMVAAFGVKVERQVSQADKHLEDAENHIRDAVADSPLLRSALSSTPIIGGLIQPPNETKSEGSQSQTKAQAKRDQKAALNEAGEADGSKSGASSTASSLPSGGTLTTAANRFAEIASGLFRTTFGLFVNSALIFFVGIFLAMAPASYRDGIVLLFPKPKRPRVREIMNDMGDTLWSWLIGRFGSMAVTGIGATVVLLACGVPMAVLLGLVTAALTFIPNIGGLVSLLLAVLFALPQGATIVAVVVGGYLVLQLVESYLVTPLIQQRQTSLPPALLISFQALMGVVFGFLGAAVASPALAAGKVLVQEAYVRDILQDDDV